jgi:ATP-dependent Clp protease ATP-binding subunit ClpC
MSEEQTIKSNLDKNHDEINFAVDDRKIVKVQDIAKVVANWSGLPLTKLTEDETSRLLKLEDILRTEVIGQERSLSAVSRALRRAGAGLRDARRPIASFLFCGPTGVGKTQLTKILAEYMFGSQKSLIRFDMSEYMEKHTVAKLIGSPPGYVGYEEGGLLTEAVRKKPYAVILFDEVEKAHPDIYNLLLQILEDGILTDSKGKVVYFNNTLIILTSNIGSQLIVDYCTANSMSTNDDGVSYEKLCQLLEGQLKKNFRPEFLNRLDEVIVFEQLTKENVGSIANIMLADLDKRLKEKKLELRISSRLLKKIIHDGYNPTFGARPLRRVITKLLEDNLAEKVLNGSLPEGSKIIADFSEKRKEVIIHVLNPVKQEEEVKKPFVEIIPDINLYEIAQKDGFKGDYKFLNDIK